MEILSGFPDNEAIKLNYDDPFLSNEAKNSLMEKNKQKSERSVRISESSRDNHASSSSIRSELDEVKQILRSMNERYRDRNPSGGYPRNFRQSGSLGASMTWLNFISPLPGLFRGQNPQLETLGYQLLAKNGV